MKALVVFSVLSFLFLAGCSENSNTLSPMDENVTLNKVPVPSKIKVTGLLSIIPTSMTEGTTLIELTGNGTQVGKFTSVSSNSYTLTSPTTGYGYNGVHTMTAANGEKLYGIYTGTWVVNSEGLYEYTLEIEFTGGSGRFEGLTGEITMFAIGENIDQLHKSITAEGTGWMLMQ